MKTRHLFTAVVLGALLVGCAGVVARREQRRAAFDPIRPEPEFRLLPDRPLHRHHAASAAAAPAEAKPPEAAYSEPPYVWKSEKLDLAGLETTSSKYFPDRFELYLIAKNGFTGKLRARALNAKQEEIGRAHAEVTLKPDGAGWTVFRFPESFGMNEVKVIAVEPAE